MLFKNIIGMKNHKGFISNKPFKMFAHQSVSDDEIVTLLRRKRFRKFNDFLKLFAKYVPGAPHNWMITSVNYSRNGAPRVSDDKPGNHYNSRALDVIPLTDDIKINFPIPLNRNLLLMRSMKGVGEKFFDVINDLPIIAFEADHIHADVNHKGGFYELRQTRPFKDKNVHYAAKVCTILSDMFDDKSLKKVY